MSHSVAGKFRSMFALMAAIGALAIAGIGVVFALQNRVAVADAPTPSSPGARAASSARDTGEEPFSHS